MLRTNKDSDNDDEKQHTKPPPQEQLPSRPNPCSNSEWMYGLDSVSREKLLEIIADLIKAIPGPLPQSLFQLLSPTVSKLPTVPAHLELLSDVMTTAETEIDELVERAKAITVPDYEKFISSSLKENQRDPMLAEIISRYQRRHSISCKLPTIHEISSSSQNCNQKLFSKPPQLTLNTQISGSCPLAGRQQPHLGESPRPTVEMMESLFEQSFRSHLQSTSTTLPSSPNNSQGKRTRHSSHNAAHDCGISPLSCLQEAEAEIFSTCQKSCNDCDHNKGIPIFQTKTAAAKTRQQQRLSTASSSVSRASDLLFDMAVDEQQNTVNRRRDMAFSITAASEASSPLSEFLELSSSYHHSSCSRELSKIELFLNDNLRENCLARFVPLLYVSKIPAPNSATSTACNNDSNNDDIAREEHEAEISRDHEKEDWFKESIPIQVLGTAGYSDDECEVFLRARCLRTKIVGLCRLSQVVPDGDDTGDRHCLFVAQNRLWKLHPL